MGIERLDSPPQYNNWGQETNKSIMDRFRGLLAVRAEVEAEIEYLTGHIAKRGIEELAEVYEAISRKNDPPVETPLQNWTEPEPTAFDSNGTVYQRYQNNKGFYPWFGEDDA